MTGGRSIERRAGVTAGTVAAAVVVAVSCVTVGGRTGLDDPGICSASATQAGPRCPPDGGIQVESPGTGATGGFGDFGGVGNVGNVGGTGNIGNVGNFGGTGNFGNFPSSGGVPASSGGDAGSGGTVEAGVGPVCGEQSITGARSPAYLLFLIDASIEMGCPIPGSGDSEIGAVIDALSVFVAEPASLDLLVGVEHFGRLASDAGAAASSCNLQDYTSPEYDLSVEPANVPVLSTVLDAYSPTPDSPLVPALGGALFHAGVLHSTPGGSRAAVVLVTGTEPKSCGAVQDAAASAAVGVSVGVPTYVIRVPTPATSSCDPESVSVDSSDYEAIAAAGNTGEAHLVDDSPTLKDDVLHAVEAIRDAVYPDLICQYTLPVLPFGSLPTVDTVLLEDESGQASIPQVEEGGCDPVEGGWYLSNDADAVVLCDATCQATKPSSVSVHIELSCPNEVPPGFL